jgi:hypothetical protein
MIDSINSTQNKSTNIDFILNCNKIDCKDVHGEKALWQSVIMQAALDATRQPLNVKERIERAKTIAWFSMQNEDFLMVCSFAEFSPESIIKGLKSAIAKNKKTIRRPKTKNLRRLDKLNQNNIQIIRKITSLSAVK